MARIHVRQLAWMALIIAALGLVNVFRVLTTSRPQLDAQDADALLVNRSREVNFKVNSPEVMAASSQLKSATSPEVAMTLPSELNSTEHHWSFEETAEAWKECRSAAYRKQLEGPLAAVSVIISFYDNENISNILMTVHSVVQRTPHALLHEVILVDDCTTKDDFQQTLSLYVSRVFGGKVKLVRSERPLGLIKARLWGIRMATAKVVVVMDSHMEVQPFWLEPLLYEIKKNRKTLAASSLDWLDKTGRNWSYRHGGTLWRTYFDWGMTFGSQMISPVEEDKRKSLTEAVVSPVIIGCIMAIEKKFFTEIGEYDEGMEKWGGENLDLPIRVWLFGGRVINVPCSRAAHVEAPGNREYRRDWQQTINKNYQRIVEVWLDDEYKHYFYHHFPSLKGVQVVNITSRLALKARAVHNFTWFLTNVFPELGLPDRDSFAFGGLSNVHFRNTCLDALTTEELRLFRCFDGQSTQEFYWSKEGHLRLPMHIMNTLYETGQPHVLLLQDEYTGFHKTGDATIWAHWRGGPIIDTGRKLCLEALSNHVVSIQRCRLNHAPQQWTFRSYTSAYSGMLNGRQGEYVDMKRQIEKLKNQSYLDRAPSGPRAR